MRLTMALRVIDEHDNPVGDALYSASYSMLRAYAEHVERKGMRVHIENMDDERIVYESPALKG